MMLGRPLHYINTTMNSPKSTPSALSDARPSKKDENQVHVYAGGDKEKDSTEETEVTRYSKKSSVLMIIFSALAIGSDGYNSAVIGNLELIFAILYPEGLTTSMTSQLSNAFTIGMIIGMLGLGYISDKLGRKSGAVVTTVFLLIGIILSTAAKGPTQNAMFWMMLIGRGVAGVGAGGYVLPKLHATMD